MRVDSNHFFLPLFGEGWVAGTPWLPWSALKIEVCFLIMQISNNPVEGGWASLKRSSSRPNLYVIDEIRFFSYLFLRFSYFPPSFFPLKQWYRTTEGTNEIKFRRLYDPALSMAIEWLSRWPL